MGSRVTTADKPKNASPPRRSRIGDLRMRDVYRGLAVLVAAAVAVVAVVLALPSGPSGPDEVAERPVAAPSTAPPTSSAQTSAEPSAIVSAEPSTGTSAEPSAIVSAEPSAGTSAEPSVSGGPSTGASAGPATTSAASLGAVPPAGTAQPGGTAQPAVTPSAAVPALPSPAPSVSQAAARPTPRPTPSPGASLAPGYTAMEAFYADARLPEVPGKPKKAVLPKPGRRVLADKRSGVAVPLLGRPWKRHRGAPFTSKQVLPKLRGRAERGMIVSCPVPIEAQKNPRDTALLAARWTLNLHPKGATVRWLTSQPVKGGWATIYQVKYGKRSSVAAVVVLDGGMAKPGLVFASIPDTQRKRWRDIYRVVSGARVLG
ncbi:hypothetical protein ACIBKY_28740 [Nonomuraea sp. NPDC050394]|uniref:hypothetical protein n=1 Tax=Nonomuraea sp. NPDC050394 TaxID=3364363 RepID=UPI0037AB881B